MLRHRSSFVARIVGLLLCLSFAGCGDEGLPPSSRLATVSGRVYDAATNTAIAGAQVQLLVVLDATAATDGTYKVGNVPAGQLDGTVSAPGYATYQINGESVTVGQTLTLNIPLQRAATK